MVGVWVIILDMGVVGGVWSWGNHDSHNVMLWFREFLVRGRMSLTRCPTFHKSCYILGL